MWVESSIRKLSEKARKGLQDWDFRHKKRPQLRSIYILMVPEAGIEPACPKAVDFESTASTDFATQALSRMRKTLALYLADGAAQDLSLKIHLTAFKISNRQSSSIGQAAIKILLRFTGGLFQLIKGIKKNNNAIHSLTIN